MKDARLPESPNFRKGSYDAPFQAAVNSGN